MKFRDPNVSIFYPLMILLICMTFCGCVTSSRTAMPAAPAPVPEPAVDWSRLPMPPVDRELIAVAGFENRSTYSADKLWDTSSQVLSSYLLRSRYFRVVEWQEMKRLFDWDTLSSASLVKSPEDMKKAQRILLCEYFITVAVTYFDVRQYGQVSTMSKEKNIDTTIRVDLLLQDAQTGEYLSTGKGEHTVRQTYAGGLSGGQTGSWSTKSADDALDGAISKALYELISGLGYNRNMSSEPASVQDTSGPGTRLNH